MQGKRFGIVTHSSAELHHLAAHLHERGLLLAYGHPFLSTNAPWEQAIKRAPKFGPKLAVEFNKRRPPVGVPTNKVKSAAPLEEIISKLAVKRYSRFSKTISNRRNRNLQRLALQIGKNVDVLIVSHGIASKAFASLSSSTLKVLNYPSIHHRAAQQLYESESRADPEFARLPRSGYHDPSRFSSFDFECDAADLILVGSEFAKSTFEDNGIDANKVVVIPYGVDLDLFHAPKNQYVNEDIFQVLFVGNVVNMKGIRYLLDGFKSFGKSDARLKMIGSYLGGIPDLDNRNTTVQHVPRVPREQLPSEYHRAEVFVLPTLFDGMGMVVLEAMACCVPVIVTDRGADQVVRDGVDGFVIPANDSAAIADRLQRLYEDSELRKSMGRNARQHAENYSWDAYSANVVREIENHL